MGEKQVSRWAYSALAAAALVPAIGLGLTGFATTLDNDVSDFLFRSFPAPEARTGAALLALDERTLAETGGVRSMRRTLAAVWPNLRASQPRLVCVDLTLTDRADETEDAALEREFAATANLLLAAEMMPDSSRWQLPLPRFASHAVAVGHVHAQPQDLDAVTREVVLERVAGRQRLWALSLEAFRVYAGAPEIDSSPTDLRVAGRTIRSRWDAGRPMRIRFLPSAAIPRVSLGDLLRDPRAGAILRDRAVFVGVTAQSAARDRLLTPLSYGVPLPGVEIHAQAFQTLDHGVFLEDAPAYAPLLLALGLAFGIAAAFTLLPAAGAYALGFLLLVIAHAIPVAAFPRGVVFPPFMPATAAWLSALSCATWQYFVVRRRLRQSESDRTRYQQAIRFVTHEMRTPLTAIQGSSELIKRYNLPEDKRRQLGEMINSESKRLARMITTFLDVEKLGAGEMELRKTGFPVQEIVDACVDRALVLAAKKQIRLERDDTAGLPLQADRELMEYALYNLITNAVKYSPPETEVRVGARRNGRDLELYVRDQGIGMNEQERRNLFRKFYRTEKAEKSGEVGTGLGLSIVQQIVAHHGGRIEVQSAPDRGSCFTIVLPSAGTVH